MKLHKHTFLLLLLFFLVRVSTAQMVFAAPGVRPANGLVNNAIAPNLGGDADLANNGTIFTHYIIILWQGIIVIGTLAMLFTLVNGALEWITAGGETEKVKHARQKMTEGIVGLIILIGTYSIIMFVGRVFQFDVLNITLPTP